MPALPDLIISSLGESRLDSPMTAMENVAFIDDESRCLYNGYTRGGQAPSLDAFELAGPREKIFFDPQITRAAIVTCGGLCPGLNAVIRGIVLELWYTYGCHDILGIRYGYQGFAEHAEAPVRLSPDLVSDIRQDGGTMLGSSRGAPPVERIVDKLQAQGVNVFFTIGGDGTMRGATAIQEEIARRGLKIAVIGVPKTIDNDIPFVKRSFGFETAVAEGARAINSAEAEARGVLNGIGLVKLMGRNAGFIAATATLASGNANFCLIPEVPFSMDGEGGFLSLLEQRLKVRHHAVVVVAEGAGQENFSPDSLSRDASGNLKLGDIGLLMKDQIQQHFAARQLPISLKYIDPSYIIRAQGPNATDQLYADRLARNAVHAAMAGKTGMLIGYWQDKLTHVPMSALKGRSRSVKRDGELWLNVRENTGQPDRIGI